MYFFKQKSWLKAVTIVLSISVVAQSAFGQDAPVKKEKKNRAIWFSWGYNTEWYTKSTIHVTQNSMGNQYDLVHVNAHDHEGWNDGIFNKQLTIPQYNYRLGFYFNKNQDLGIEANFDHTKYVVADGQTMEIKGTLSHSAVDKNIVFSGANGFYYYLNNGANFLLFNLVKRLGLYHDPSNKLRIDLTGKVGIGPVIPHVQNSLFGQANDQHFQLGGWNTGAETALRVTAMKYVFLEFSQKVDYARYSQLGIYDGTARQNFGCYELILSLGVTFPTHAHNPLFTATAPIAPAAN